jgi:hypothetical protein
VIGSNLVSWHLHRDYRSTLKKELPDQFFCNLCITVSDVKSCFLVTFVNLSDISHIF